jgi:hypothetical protein
MRRSLRGAVLLWMVVGLLALAVTAGAATATFYQLARLGRRNHDRLIASQLGQQEMERIRGGLPSGMGRHESVCEGLQGGRTVVTVTPDREPGLRLARVEVRWRDPDGERRMTWSTLVGR